MIATQLKVSILGAGPAGFALAVDLESKGASVLLYSHPDHRRHADAVISRGGLEVSGAIEASTKLYITSDIQEAVEFSRIVIITVPSTGQETLLCELKQFSLLEHTIIAVPGNLFSLVATAGMKVRNFLETNISPYSCRMSEGGLAVFGKKGSFSIAALHGDCDLISKAKVERIFCGQRLRWSHNVIEVSLTNINGVFHPLMMLMNAGRIESTGGDFRVYADGLTRSVANAILAVDRVRLEIGKAFGFKLDSVIATSNRCYNAHFTDLVDLARHSEPHNKLMAPGIMDHRNLSEDVPDLLVCWHGLAEKLEINASPIKAVIDLASIATGIDYMESGRNMTKLGLQDLSRSQLLEQFSVRYP
ncbi:hypothetical protein LZ554_006770 [Drepanopeziza brunnea f. sp. 'monogermtubi']|nr:hypothetical protein LZ554_006770 [Drepanopeziza brunnea f. sp. 'monogermtubi']